MAMVGEGVQFAREVRLVLEAIQATGGEAAGDCRDILGAMPADLPPPRPGPKLKVAGLLDGALGRANGTPLAALARAAAPIIRAAAWFDSPQYRDRGLDPRFFDNYGFVKFMGPGTNLPGRGVAAGFLMLGPDLLYPAHAHPARELYIVLSGTADWQRGEEDFLERRPGDYIVHPSWVRHAMRTRGETLLAMYFWTGDLETSARLLPDA